MGTVQCVDVASRGERGYRITDGMKISVVQGEDIDAGHIGSWRRVQAENPLLASPFFAPEFTQAVADVRDDVRVAVLEDHGSVAFFPHQRNGVHGRPVGGPLSDYQGIIARDDAWIDPKALLRACKLHVFEYDHLLAAQRAFVPGHRHYGPSYVISLESGYDAFFQAKKAAHVMEIRTAGRHQRAMENELGPLRFVPHSTDPAIVEQLLRWKRQQYRDTQVADVFAVPWSRRLLYRIIESQAPSFSGMLSALYAGATLVAAHLGMRTPSVWHYWILAYDHAHGRYSPGTLLLLEMLRHADSVGIAQFDLGKGYAPYKEKLHTGTIPLAEGFCERPSLTGALHHARMRAKEWIRQSSLHPVARTLARRLEKRLNHG